MSSANTTVTVRTPDLSYDVEIGTGLLAGIGSRIDALLDGGLRAGKQRAYIVSSPEILELWGDELTRGFSAAPTVLTVPSGESQKRLATVERLLEELAGSGADRDSVLIAFGGGVLGDMTGFLAAIYMRGIRYVQVPTTLLAQVDSSIGGKTGVNLAAGKNLAGAFHHPLAVYADVATLTTLPSEELRAGLQESIKAGILRDAELFSFLEWERDAVLAGDEKALTKVVAASVRVKAEVVNSDERESGLRMILNLGHTLGHAIEAATEYRQLLHGEAVAWGMIAAIRIAAAREMISGGDADRMQSLIRAYGPMKSFAADAEQLVALTAKDKKNRSGARSFILPTGIGSVTIVRDVNERELLDAATLVVDEARGLRRDLSGASR
ncbi:MAG TPA: 3-dehydroquinate synthase [Candidatus Aquilonibacter sp.]|nr:3-dehydroquinate synthase [Candidatus Aquilonibacter sp.]